MEICSKEICTGCGLCQNICPYNAIIMQEDKHGFIFPSINENLCHNCGLCQNRCPSNAKVTRDSTVKKVYAAWNINKRVRRNSTSGGVFSLMAQKILQKDGIVVGVKWTDNFEAAHCVVDCESDIHLLNGSKYVQSQTYNIYQTVKKYLQEGRVVLFSGTPCQNHALRSFLNKDYDNLFQIDVVCHGVPSKAMLQRHLKEINTNKRKITNICLRFKNPWWDYSSVRIDYDDLSFYQKYTVDDSYFTLFNLGFSLRHSCHICKYACSHRYSDITLADYWGYSPKKYEMRDYLKGTSLVLINTDKGNQIFEQIKEKLIYDISDLNQAKKSNKCLSAPFQLPEKETQGFWLDYENGMSVDNLCKKYVPNPYKIPKFIWIRRLIQKNKWVLKR